MRDANVNAAIHKDVIIIGNGPSGIALSYMLSGNIPFVVSNDHPDEMLSARLRRCVGESLVVQDLEYLASGLEGRTTNPVSLLLDSLTHPCADIGLEMEPLIEWKKNGVEIDHIVFGKGPPGGSWHSMDPHILTLSLGTWMALPGLKYQARDNAEKRAFACNVAKYYEQYVKEMNLTKYFKDGTIVTGIRPIPTDESPEVHENCQDKWVQKIDNDVSDRTKFCSQPELEEAAETDGTPSVSPGTCSFANALNFFLSRGHRKWKTDRCCKRKYESLEANFKVLFSKYSQGQVVENLMGDRGAVSDAILHRNDVRLSFRKKDLNCDKNRSVSFSCDLDSAEAPSDNSYGRSFDEQECFISDLRNSRSLDLEHSLRKVPKLSSDLRKFNLNSSYDPTVSPCNIPEPGKPKWIVDVYDVKTRSVVSYTCNYLVLANGSSDLPNRLAISNEKRDPGWLLHDVRSLEIELELYVQCNRTDPDPVLVVGAGLSAADAIIAARGKNVPVLHVFRNKSADLGKQLPENMYPEYHKVHQMMQDGGSTYSLYTALPECTLTDYCEDTRSVTLTSKEGKEVQYRVSFAVVLIGSRPDLSFLPESFRIGTDKRASIDSKTNPIDINRLNHSVVGYEGLYAVGPIAGDHFVRFLPGGSLAVVSDLYKKYRC